MDHRLIAVVSLFVLTSVGFAQECPDQIGGLPHGWVDVVAASGDHVFYDTNSANEVPGP